MGFAEIRARFITLVLRRHRDLRSFDDEIQAEGGVAGRVDAGTRSVDTRKIVGSVGRSRTLRSDFFYKGGRPITARFRRVGEAIKGGVELPPLELYKVKRARNTPAAPPSEYYVVDGHHRVAMARKLGQDFLDAHVVEYTVGSPPPHPGARPDIPGGAGETLPVSPQPDGQPPRA